MDILSLPLQDQGNLDDNLEDLFSTLHHLDDIFCSPLPPVEAPYQDDEGDLNWWDEVDYKQQQEPSPSSVPPPPAPSSRSVSPAQSDVGSAPASSGTKRSASSLSPEIQNHDDDDAKRLIRLEKNREAASQSRARKKSYMKELEVKCRMLETHVSQLQRVMTVTSMENAALKAELVRVKKPKDGVKNSVAEPAVLESNSLPLEFLPHRSYHYPTGQQCRTAGQFQGFLVMLLQLLMLGAVNASNDSHTSPLQPLRKSKVSPYKGLVTSFMLEVSEPYRGASRRKQRRRQLDVGLERDGSFVDWRSLMRPRVKRLRSSRIL